MCVHLHVCTCASTDVRIEVHVYVCVRLEGRERERDRQREREREWVCVCVCVWEREREGVCVCERERDRYYSIALHCITIHELYSIFYFCYFTGTTLQYVFQSVYPFPQFIRKIVSKSVKSAINLLLPLIKTGIWDTLKVVAFSSFFRIVLECAAFMGGFPPEQPTYFHSYMKDVFHTRYEIFLCCVWHIDVDYLSWYAIIWYFMFCHDMICYVMLCNVMLLKAEYLILSIIVPHNHHHNHSQSCYLKHNITLRIITW